MMTRLNDVVAWSLGFGGTGKRERAGIKSVIRDPGGRSEKAYSEICVYYLLTDVSWLFIVR